MLLSVVVGGSFAVADAVAVTVSSNKFSPLSVFTLCCCCCYLQRFVTIGAVAVVVAAVVAAVVVAVVVVVVVAVAIG